MVGGEDGGQEDELPLYASIKMDHRREKRKQMVAPNRIMYAKTSLSQSLLSIPLPYM
jgi:hypothetical protein